MFCMVLAVWMDRDIFTYRYFLLKTVKILFSKQCLIKTVLQKSGYNS